MKTKFIIKYIENGVTKEDWMYAMCIRTALAVFFVKNNADVVSITADK